MSFVDELRIKSSNIHLHDNAYVGYLVELIKQECRIEAEYQNYSLKCILDRDGKGRFFLNRDLSGKGIHCMCCGYFGDIQIGNVEEINRVRDGYTENDEYIVNKLRKELGALGFSKVDISLTYGSQKYVLVEHKKNFFGTLRKIEIPGVHKDYYKKLYIEVIW